MNEKRRKMTNILKTIYVAELLILFCFIFFAQKAFAIADPQLHNSFTCTSSGTCGQTATDTDCWNDSRSGLHCNWDHEQCGTWQKCSSDMDNYMQCACDPQCLAHPQGPQYYDSPGQSSGQMQNPNDVKLPVMFSWNNVPGWTNKSLSTITKWENLGYGKKIHDFEADECDVDPTFQNKGPKSYVIEIQDAPETAGSGIDNINYAKLTAGQKTGPTTIDSSSAGSEGITQADGRLAFFKVKQTNQFNSRDDGNECFFNSSSPYRWRVRACCNYNGTGCTAPGQWWNFSTSTAPEMISPLDPDWNGKDYLKNESFKNIIPGKDPLKWCAARLPKDYQTQTRAVQYAESYQLMVTSDEQNGFTGGIWNAISNGLSFLWGGQKSASSDQQKTHVLAIINGSLIYNVLPDPTTGDVDTSYPSQGRNDLAFFSRERKYSWKLKSCSDNYTTKCFDDYGQEWKFETSNDAITPPAAISPKDDSSDNNPIGFPINLSWTIPAGANSFQYQTTIPGLANSNPVKTPWNAIPSNDTSDATKKLLSLDNSGIKLDTVYKWQVESCAPFDSSQCDGWSNWFSFRTTGRPPRTASMQPNLSSAITFPQSFQWEKVPGAKSYNIELDGANGKKIKTVKFGPDGQGQPGVQFDYPDIQPPPDNTSGKTYTWKIQTCADDSATVCGTAWSSQYLIAKRPGKPVLQTQINTDGYGSLSDIALNWNGQTKYYWLTINYNKPQPQTQSGCDISNPVVSQKIDGKSCSLQNNCLPANVKTSCIGSYQWTIQPCVDPDCSDRGNDNALTGNFSVKSGSASDNSLSVCGQAFDNPKTDWDETQTCQVKDIFLLMKVAIDFLLFRLSVLLLPLLVLATGGLFYLSPNNPDMISKAKKMWQAIGIGYAILFTAWILVSWLMVAVGFAKPDWWKII
jgi:hypothetical protein